jgi:VWFA-related protein
MLRIRLLPVVLLSLAAMPAPAQAPETGSLAGLPPPEPNRVVLDVAVTGEDGSPLPGLTAEDFEVYDDGEPVPGPRFAPPEPTHLAVVLDETRLAPAHRTAAFAELRRQLEALTSSTDRILVARQDREIRIEQELTSDRALVAGALDRLEKAPSGVGSEMSAQRALLEEIRFGMAPSETAVGPGRGSDRDDPRKSAESAGATTLAAVRQLAGQERARSLRTLASLSDLTASLAALPGRKAVLLLSGGIDLHPGEPLFQAWIDRYSSVTAATGAGSVALEMPTYQTGRELQDLIADAGADRVAFYTVDPSGGEALTPPSERRSRGTAALAARTPVEESLLRIAEETGGAFSPLPDGLGRLAERIGADFRLSYRLEFESSHGGDGAQHNLEVRVRRPGAKVRHAARYRDESPDQRLRDRAASALLLGVAANPLDLQIELGQPSRERKGTDAVPVKVKIPLARLALLPRGDFHQGQLSILLLLQDGQGNLSAAPKLAVPLQIPNQQLVESMARIGTFDTSIRLHGGEQRIAVAVRDEVGGVDAALALPLTPSPAAGKARGRRR